MGHLWHFIKNIYSYAGKYLYFNLIGMIFISLFESIGIFLLIPLVSLTGVFDLQVHNVKLFSWLQEIFKSMPEMVSLSFILCIYVLLIIGQSFLQRYQTILNTRIQHGYLSHLRDDTYKAILRSNWGFFLRKRKSDLINLMINDIARVNGGIQMTLSFIASFVFSFIQIGIAFFLSSKITLATLLLGSVILLFSRKRIKKSSLIAEETIELGKTYLAGINDHFNGIKDIKSNTLEETHIFWVRSLGERLDHNMIEMAKLNTISQIIFKIVSAFLMAGFVFFSIEMLRAQPAQLMIILAIFTRIWPRLSSIQSSLEQIGATLPSLKALIDLQKECLASQEIMDEAYQNLKHIEIKREIECRDVSFRYNLTQPTFALKNISIVIPINQMTAVVGRSGAGKSTFIDILMGLNQPEKGQVLVDGKVLEKDNLLSFRNCVSYVPQDPFLFNTTVKENLLMMEPNASEQEIWDALEFSSAAEFVKKLPNGLNTLIGDRGIKLSGGERQRLVLARAILRHPSILVLDEATSALDTENETKIQEALEGIKGSITIIVIAHRLSTIRNADQVVVLEQGEIIQQGQFNQLANEKRGMLSRLLKRQMELSV